MKIQRTPRKGAEANSAMARPLSLALKISALDGLSDRLFVLEGRGIIPNIPPELVRGLDPNVTNNSNLLS